MQYHKKDKNNANNNANIILENYALKQMKDLIEQTKKN